MGLAILIVVFFVNVIKKPQVNFPVYEKGENELMDLVLA